MRGLPDSAVYGTYKRLNRKSRRSSHDYKAESEFIYDLLMWVFKPIRERNKK